MKHLTNQPPLPPRQPRPSRGGFTLIELLVVIAIIVILATIAVPAVKNLTKSNDTSQAANLVRTMIAQARTIALSQHRVAGVVFFEESGTYSRPVNAAQTAMQLFVEDYNQRRLPPADSDDYSVVTGATVASSTFPVDYRFLVVVSYSPDRQYLPSGIKLATLSDESTNTGNINTAENSSANANLARAILFDANGQLITRDGLATPNPGAGTRGTYPMAYGDWHFLKPKDASVDANRTKAASSPGFFLYNKADFDTQTFASDTARADWLKQHADVIIVNSYTGTVIR